MSFARSFLDVTVRTLERVSTDDIEQVVEVVRQTRDHEGRIFFCGSGGGAGHASHAACDFRQLANIEAYCVTDNVSELTARINDSGWNTSYADWLRTSRLGPDDCLFVFSVGGGDVEAGISANLVEAIELARERGAGIVGIAGRDGGALRRRATASIVIPPVDEHLVTAQTEGLQAVMWHLIVSHPALATRTPKWESVNE
jgi:D-sedoheptulose 7-phosphate isomerase